MQVYIGIDWSDAKHDVCLVNEMGALVTQFPISHSLEGFEKLRQQCRQLGSEPQEWVVGLETAHNLLVDYLWEQGCEQLYVLPPTRINSERPKQHASRAYTDRSDSQLIARLLRTQREAFHPWHPDGLLVRQMRIRVGLGLYLTQEIVRTSNRLTAVLKRYYPAALKVFSGTKTQILHSFLQAYPTPQAAAQLSFEQFAAFARQHGYRQGKQLLACYNRLQQAQPQALDVTAAYAYEAQLLSRQLAQQLRDKRELLKELHQLFLQHPDQAIFASLPGTGTWLAPALLAKIGEDRRRFPHPEYLQAQAGTCPVTRQSGKRHQVVFRHACDHELRWIVQQWARASVEQSGWAAAYFKEVRIRCRSTSQAYRCLGNRWLKILWKLWQSGQTYDEGYHLNQIALRRKPKATA